MSRTHRIRRPPSTLSIGRESGRSVSRVYQMVRGRERSILHAEPSSTTTSPRRSRTRPSRWEMRRCWQERKELTVEKLRLSNVFELSAPSSSFSMSTLRPQHTRDHLKLTAHTQKSQSRTLKHAPLPPNACRTTLTRSRDHPRPWTERPSHREHPRTHFTGC